MNKRKLIDQLKAFQPTRIVGSKPGIYYGWYPGLVNLESAAQRRSEYAERWRAAVAKALAEARGDTVEVRKEKVKTGLRTSATWTVYRVGNQDVIAVNKSREGSFWYPEVPGHVFGGAAPSAPRRPAKAGGGSGRSYPPSPKRQGREALEKDITDLLLIDLNVSSTKRGGELARAMIAAEKDRDSERAYDILKEIAEQADYGNGLPIDRAGRAVFIDVGDFSATTIFLDHSRFYLISWKDWTENYE